MQVNNSCSALLQEGSSIEFQGEKVHFYSCLNMDDAQFETSFCLHIFCLVSRGNGLFMLLRRRRTGDTHSGLDPATVVITLTNTQGRGRLSM